MTTRLFHSLSQADLGRIRSERYVWAMCQACWEWLHFDNRVEMRGGYCVGRPFPQTRLIEDCMCWNAMSPAQQDGLTFRGWFDWNNGYQGGTCNNRAEVPLVVGGRHGPRFYCTECAEQTEPESPEWVLGFIPESIHPVPVKEIADPSNYRWEIEADKGDLHRMIVIGV